MTDFNHIAQLMKYHGMKLPEEQVKISIQSGKSLIEKGLDYFSNSKADWLPEYNLITEWLSDNEGKGLFMYGDFGRGKSLLARYVLPGILLSSAGKIVSVYDMAEINKKLDEALTKRVLSLDDVGVEDVKVNFGERRMAFAELMDSIEKNNKLAIITTNLNQDELRSRYGDRVMDRIIATTVRVQFKGKSLRK